MSRSLSDGSPGLSRATSADIVPSSLLAVILLAPHRPARAQRQTLEDPQHRRAAAVNPLAEHSHGVASLMDVQDFP